MFLLAVATSFFSKQHREMCVINSNTSIDKVNPSTIFPHSVGFDFLPEQRGYTKVTIMNIYTIEHKWTSPLSLRYERVILFICLLLYSSSAAVRFISILSDLGTGGVCDDGEYCAIDRSLSIMQSTLLGVLSIDPSDPFEESDHEYSDGRSISSVAISLSSSHISLRLPQSTAMQLLPAIMNLFSHRMTYSLLFLIDAEYQC